MDWRRKHEPGRRKHPATGPHTGIRVPRPRDARRTPARRRNAARLAPGIAGPDRACQVGGRRAEDEPLVRRLRNAASLRHLQWRGLLRNRFIQSKAYRAAEEKGELVYSEFATDP